MRAPFQILAIPYRIEEGPLFCIFRRRDGGQWQFVSGGGEDNESPEEAAAREIREKTGVEVVGLRRLVSMTYVPASVISQRHRTHWGGDVHVLPEYHFAFPCEGEIALSDEHLECVWVGYEAAMDRLTWDSNRTALYELMCRLTAERDK